MEINPEDIPKIAAEVLSPIPETRLEAVRKIRQLLSLEVRPPIDQVIQSGVLPELVSFLGNDDDSTLQFEAAWSLTNVGSGTSEQARALVDAKAIPGFVHLLCSKNDDLREQSIWALGNIAGDCPEFRDRILEEDALKYLLHCIITSRKLAVVRNAIWTVSNLCRGKPAPSFSLVSPAIPVLALCLSSQDNQMLVDVCWSLAYLSDGSDDRIEKIVKSDDSVIPQLVELMESESAGIRVPALRTIGNILTSDGDHTQLVLDYPRALPVLKNKLNDSRKSVRKEACWAISNITAGSAADIQMVIDNGVVSVLIHLVMSSGSDFDVKKEAVWALGNMVSGGKVEQIIYLVEQNILPVFVFLLGAFDAKAILVCLEAIKNVLECGKNPIHFGAQNPFCEKLEECGGLDKLEELQSHQNQEVYKRAFSILEKYFIVEEEENEGFEMGSSEGNFSFGGAMSKTKSNT